MSATIIGVAILLISLLSISGANHIEIDLNLGADCLIDGKIPGKMLNVNNGTGIDCHRAPNGSYINYDPKIMAVQLCEGLLTTCEPNLLPKCVDLSCPKDEILEEPRGGTDGQDRYGNEEEEEGPLEDPTPAFETPATITTTILPKIVPTQAPPMTAEVPTEQRNKTFELTKHGQNKDSGHEQRNKTFELTNYGQNKDSGQNIGYFKLYC